MYLLLRSVAGAGILFALTACRPDTARTQGRLEFRERIAALKVATAGCTYEEFRERLLAAKTSFEMNKDYLTDIQPSFAKLSLKLNACDIFWSKANLDVTLYNHQTHFLYTREELAAIVIVNPAASSNFDLPFIDRYNNPAFDATWNTRLALSEIGDDCEVILAVMPTTSIASTPHFLIPASLGVTAIAVVLGLDFIRRKARRADSSEPSFPLISASYGKYHCPHCRGGIEFPRAAAGTPIQCPHCGSSITLGFC
jgi:DNA-directed RNA polymerase subunit RPC12/RpoP